MLGISQSINVTARHPRYLAEFLSPYFYGCILKQSSLPFFRKHLQSAGWGEQRVVQSQRSTDHWAAVAPPQSLHLLLEQRLSQTHQCHPELRLLPAGLLLLWGETIMKKKLGTTKRLGGKKYRKHEKNQTDYFHSCSGCVGPVGTPGDVQRGSDVMAQQTTGWSKLHHHRLFQRPAVLTLPSCFYRKISRQSHLLEFRFH